MTRFYGYVDRTDAGEPFYVGKGVEKRLEKFKRNEKHGRVSAEHGCSRTIEFSSENETEVLTWEVSKISEYRTYETRNTGIGCNLTRGGDGISGYKHTEKAKRRTSDAIRAWHATMPEEKAKALAEKISKSIPHEKRSESAKKWMKAKPRGWQEASAARARATLTPEMQRQFALAQHAKTTPEQRSEIARKREAAKRARRSIEMGT